MILGITGTIGAGKGTVVDYLVSEKGFAHYPVRDFLLEEIAKRGLPPNRDSMQAVGNELRATNGPAYIAERAYARAAEKGGNALIESIRAIAEADFLKSKGAVLIAVNADQKIRYERIQERGLSTDHVDFDTWVAQEQRELVSEDPSGMNVTAVMARADYHIENNGTREELHAAIEQMLSKLAL